MPNWRHGSERLKLMKVALNGKLDDGSECQNEEDDDSKCQTDDMAMNA